MALKVGSRVVRGPDWKWRDQDGGDGYVGTVVIVGGGVSNSSHPNIIAVCWDMGNVADYRAGFDGHYDLLIYDNAATGVKHNGVICNSCEEADIAGIRWKCNVCYDYDLCTACYMKSQHDLKHVFLRKVEPNSVGRLMTPRSHCSKTKAKGLFGGSRVCRGRDWAYLQQDGGSGNTGQVIRTKSWANTARSAVAVRWEGGGSFEYRVGHSGKVDVKCLQATEGQAFYKDHLPKCGEIDVINVGDRVVVRLNKQELIRLQDGHGEWVSDMEKYIGQIGKVIKINSSGDIKIQYSDRNSWNYNPAAVTKLTTFHSGDRVRVSSDIAKVKELQKGHGGWASPMQQTIGKEGRVVLIDADGDVKVNVGGHSWTFHPDALSLVEQGTGAEGLFQQESVGDLAQLLRLILPFGGLLDSGDWREIAAAAAASSKPDSPIETAKQFLNNVLEGDIKKVTEALAKDKNMIHVSVKGMTALHLACFQGHMALVELLVKRGAKLDVIDEEGDSPLANAVHQDHSKIVQYLLNHKADPNTVNTKRGGTSPLHLAVRKDHIECVRALIMGKCNPNLQDAVGDTPLHDAIRKNHNEIIKLLVAARDCDLTIKNKKGFNPLHYAALLDNPHATRLILKKQRSLVDIRKDDGYAALHLAVRNHHRNIVQILIAEGKCAIDLYNEEHQTPLLLAVAGGRTPIIEDLIDHGADVNTSDADGNSCLHIAAMKHRQSQDATDTPGLKKFRKKYGDNGITTPVLALMCYLVESGANITQSNLKKLTPLGYLKEAGVRRVLEHIARKRDQGEVDGRLERVVSRSSDSDVSEYNCDDPPVGNTDTDSSFCGIHIIKDPDQELKMGEVIGRGGFGVVCKAQWRGTPVAVKTLSTSGSNEAEVDKEIAIHKRVLHPNIVPLMAVGHRENLGEALIVMQLIAGKNLGTIIFQDGNPHTFTQKVRISRDLLSAITYLHHCRILHLDIKPQNVIIEDQTHKPYLCDLGLAHIKTRCTMSRSTHLAARGTHGYMPPETATSEDGNMAATTATDVWSLAATLLEFFTGENMWPKSISPVALCVKFMSDDVTPKSVEKLEERVRKVLKPCFQKKPGDRPSVEKLMQEFSGLM